MKKIGLLNFQHVNDNYGAVLQAAALAYTLKSLGFNDVEHINFVPEQEPGPAPLSKKQRIRRLISPALFSIIREKFKRSKVVVRNSIAFENFRKKWIPRSDKKYRNFVDLREADSSYRAVIVGSDQVWRTKYTGKFALVFFLSFLGASTRRIAYAASFGVNHWETPRIEGLSEQVRNEVQKFHSVSVRENAGIQICKDVMGVEATHVLDPTMLVPSAFFNELTKDVLIKSELDIVFYKLDADDAFFNAVEHVSKKLNYKAENIFYKTSTLGFKSYTDVDEWVAKIKNSKFIITDSFHCVCFAIIFKKQFICIVNKNRGLERLESMLGQLGLLDRLCVDLDFSIIEKLLNSSIDYESIDRVLEPLRVKSTQFLLTSLENV